MRSKQFYLLLLVIFFINSKINFPQQKNRIQQFSHEIDGLSSGAHFDIWLQNEIKEGRINKADVENFLRRNAMRKDKTIAKVNSISSMTTFDGFNYDDNSTETSGSSYIPPDPSAAAGTDRVIAVVNVMIECRNKTGSLIFRDALKDFFSSLSPNTFTFDPKVIFDQYESRFLVVTLEKEESGSNPSGSNTSKIFLAVSKTASPASATSSDWYFHSIDAKTTIDGLDTWADYPGFAIDEEAIYITNNMFTHIVSGSRTNKGVRLWIVNKGTSGGFYAGSSASVNIYNPYASSGYNMTTQPAHVFGSSGIASGVGTYLVGYSGLTGDGNEYIQWARVDDPLGSPSFTVSEVNIGDVDNTDTSMPDAPQSGTSTSIETNDRRALHSVWRNNYLWLTTTVVPGGAGDDVGEATAYWVKLSASGGSCASSDKGKIGGEDIASNTYTFFPSVAVNSSGDAIFGFCASASTIYPGAYYAGRESGDASGTVRTPQTIKAGVDYYIRKFSGTQNRWGDYTGASVDPSDDQTFWLFNEYAATRSESTDGYGHDGRWGTIYAKIPIAALPVEVKFFTANVLNNSVHLLWETATEINNYGFEVERSLSSHSYFGKWEKIGFVKGNGNSNSQKNYSFIDNYPKVGLVQYRLKQIDFDGTFEYSTVNEININAPTNYTLEQNFPNPFNPETVISYQLSNYSHVTLKVYDILGREVATIIDEYKPAGKYVKTFHGTSLPSGQYFYQLRTGNYIETKKMILIK